MVEDLTGKTFTRLTVIKFAHKKKKFYNNSKKATSVNYWLCKCICGNTLIVEHYHLKYGHTKSCGCLQREKSTKINTKHGFEKSRLYHIWQGMKRRCLNKNEQNFDRYGGRGIKICDKWLKNPKSFILWALSNGYNDNLTLE